MNDALRWVCLFRCWFSENEGMTPRKAILCVVSLRGITSFIPGSFPAEHQRVWEGVKPPGYRPQEFVLSINHPKNWVPIFDLRPFHFMTSSLAKTSSPCRSFARGCVSGFGFVREDGRKGGCRVMGFFFSVYLVWFRPNGTKRICRF